MANSIDKKGLSFVQYFTAILIIYYIFKCIYPDILLGGNIVENNTNAIFAQMSMATAGVMAYVYIWKNWAYIKSHTNLLFFFRYLCLYLVYFIFRDVLSGFSIGAAGEFLKETCTITYFFVFYVLFHKDYAKTKKCVMFLIPVLLFQVFYQLQVSLAYVRMMHIETEMDSNSGAAFAAALVLPMCIKKNKYAIFLYLMLFVLVLYCGQRSGILTAVLSVPFVFKEYSKHLKKWYILALFGIAAIMAVPYIVDSYENLMQRTQNEAEKGSYGSGRSDIYPLVWNTFWEGDIQDIVLGSPKENLMNLIGKKIGAFIIAHNGWLDMLYMYGLLGMSIYIGMFVSLIKRRKYIKKYAPQFYGLYIYMILYWLVKNTVTHGNLGITFIPFSIAWAYMFYIANNNEAKLLNHNETRIPNLSTH